MKGLYLYCIRQKGRSEFFGKGIDRGRILVLPYQDLEAVISRVSLEKFTSEKIQRKAQEDLKWITKKAEIHEQVVEQAMGKNRGIPVIPMQFGVIFKTKESLEENLKKLYEQFKKSLKNLVGKQEWGVKVFLKENIFKKSIARKNKAVLVKNKKIESMSRGEAFFVQKEIDAIIEQIKDKKLDRIIKNIYESAGQIALNKNKSKLLAKEFTGRPEEMILNAFYLLKDAKLARFQNKIKKIKEKYNSQGLDIEMTGPWPCYHNYERSE
ncbi:MAG: GvpL/GvpF family gas vesicle protein [bacterium]